MMALYSEGRHTCEVVGQGLDIAGKNETPYAYLAIIPDGGVEKRRVRLWVNSPANVKRTAHQLSMIGWKPPKLSDLEGDSPVCDLRGQRLILECYHDEYESVVRDQWRFPKEDVTEAPKGLGKELDKLYKDELASVSPKAELASGDTSTPKDDLF